MTHDPSKSLGERLYEAASGAFGLWAWTSITDAERTGWEKAALNFTARLSDAKEDNRASRSQPVSGAVGQDSDTGKVSG